ncbi:hypothetical protein SUGI_1489230 [Cryptomeria japonica]|uniref:Uncharacterized protein n=1 Tax=Cryptomeria japonica TaxID=3369 RepID=A0AAD3RPS6_CRYJA|nr:hypothetical protein SUGI_1489230 [Cryptomeria japonica]
MEISEGIASKVRTSLPTLVCSEVPTMVRNAGANPGAPRCVLQGAACTKSDPGLPRVRTSRAPWCAHLGWGLRGLVGTMVAHQGALRSVLQGAACTKSEPGLPRVRTSRAPSPGVGTLGWVARPGAHQGALRSVLQGAACTKSEPGLPRVRTFAAVRTMACTKSEPGLPRWCAPRVHLRRGCAPWWAPWCAPRSAPKCAPRCGRARSRSPGLPRVRTLACTFGRGCAPWWAPWCAPRSAPKCAPRCGVHEVGARFAPGAHLACTFAAVGTMACTKSEPGLPRVRTSRAPSPGWAPRLGCAPWCAPRSAPKCAPRCGVHEVGARFAPGAHLACTFARRIKGAHLGVLRGANPRALRGAHEVESRVNCIVFPGCAPRCATSARTKEGSEVCSKVRTMACTSGAHDSELGLTGVRTPWLGCAPFVRSQGAHEVGARFAPGAHLRQGAHLDAHALAGLRTLVGAMVRTFRALQGGARSRSSVCPGCAPWWGAMVHSEVPKIGAHQGALRSALQGAREVESWVNCPVLPRKLLNGAHHWCAPKCAPKLSPAACTCPGRAPGPRPASLTCPGRLVRNLRVRNITVHLGQRARLDRTRALAEGAHRFHLGARAAPRAHRGARTTPGLHRGLCARGASGARSVSPPRARGSAGSAPRPGPAPTRTQTGKRFIQIALRPPGEKLKKGCNTGTSREVTHPSTTPAQARLTAEF